MKKAISVVVIQIFLSTQVGWAAPLEELLNKDNYLLPLAFEPLKKSAEAGPIILEEDPLPVLTETPDTSGTQTASINGLLWVDFDTAGIPATPSIPGFQFNFLHIEIRPQGAGDEDPAIKNYYIPVSEFAADDLYVITGLANGNYQLRSRYAEGNPNEDDTKMVGQFTSLTNIAIATQYLAGSPTIINISQPQNPSGNIYSSNGLLYLEFSAPPPADKIIEVQVEGSSKRTIAFIRAEDLTEVSPGVFRYIVTLPEDTYGGVFSVRARYAEGDQFADGPNIRVGAFSTDYPAKLEINPQRIQETPNVTLTQTPNGFIEVNFDPSTLPVTQPPSTHGALTIPQFKANSGANLPWERYGWDLGGRLLEDASVTLGYSSNLAELEADFKKLKDAGAGLVRVFLFADLRSGLQYDANRNITSFTFDDKVFADMQALIDMADKYDIKLLPVLFDFHIADGAVEGGGTTGGEYPELFTDPAKKASLLSLFETFIAEFGSNENIYAWDVMNEPENAGAVSFAAVKSFVGDFVDMIHAQAPGKLVTVGANSSASVVDNWTGIGLDLYQFHYFDYMEPTNPLDGPVQNLGLDKPVLIGELEVSNANVRERLAQLYDNGYEGALLWSLKAAPPAGTTFSSDIRNSYEAWFALQDFNFDYVHLEVTPAAGGEVKNYYIPVSEFISDNKYLITDLADGNYSVRINYAEGDPYQVSNKRVGDFTAPSELNVTTAQLPDVVSEGTTLTATTSNNAFAWIEIDDADYAAITDTNQLHILLDAEGTENDKNVFIGSSDSPISTIRTISGKHYLVLSGLADGTYSVSANFSEGNPFVDPASKQGEIKELGTLDVANVPLTGTPALTFNQPDGISNNGLLFFEFTSIPTNPIEILLDKVGSDDPLDNIRFIIPNTVGDTGLTEILDSEGNISGYLYVANLREKLNDISGSSYTVKSRFATGDEQTTPNVQTGEFSDTTFPVTFTIAKPLPKKKLKVDIKQPKKKGVFLSKNGYLNIMLDKETVKSGNAFVRVILVDKNNPQHVIAYLVDLSEEINVLVPLKKGKKYAFSISGVPDGEYFVSVQFAGGDPFSTPNIKFSNLKKLGEIKVKTKEIKAKPNVKNLPAKDKNGTLVLNLKKPNNKFKLYEIEVSETEDFSDPAKIKTHWWKDIGKKRRSITVEDGKKYYVRVRGWSQDPRKRNKSGKARHSDWKDAGASEIAIENVPAAPQFRGDTELTLKKGDIFKLGWNKVDGASYYDVEFANNLDFNNSDSFTQKGNNRRFSSRFMKKRHTYYIRVRAWRKEKVRDGNTASQYSEYITLHIK